MIISEKIKVKIGSFKQAKYYEKNGLKAELNDEIYVNVSLLPTFSHLNIEVSCDVCDEKKMIEYGSYNKLTNNNVEKYYCVKCNHVKIKQSKLKNYGDENYNNTVQYKKTCLKKYGVDNYSKTDSCKYDVKKTKNKKYNNENYNNKDKSKITCLNRYGVECHLQNSQVKEKIKTTILDRYGVISYSKTAEFKIKILKTNLERYGIENYSNTAEIKKTCLKKYGNENYNNQEKFKKTCLERYGVEYPIHNIDIFKKIQKSCYKLNKYKEIDYQGTYELDFLINFYDLFKIERGPIISYIFNDKNKKYYPDFFISKYNLIVEIKSDYTYNVEKNKNEAKKNAALNDGYNFIFIIDKKYTEFLSFI